MTMASLEQTMALRLLHSSQKKVQACNMAKNHSTAVDYNLAAERTAQHTDRPRPGRRRSQRLTLSTLSFYIAVFLSLCCGSVAAQAPGNGNGGYLLSSTLDKLARRGEILIDRSEPPSIPLLEKRQGGSPFGNTVTLTNPTATTNSPLTTHNEPTQTPKTPITNSPSPTTSTLMVDPGVTAPSALPTPFDTSLGANFTSSACPQFFQTFLASKEFQSCLPLSQLLQNSNSFFQAEKSALRTSETLDATCSVNINNCISVMGTLARTLRSDSTCGPDFKLGNPVVMQAYNGFLAYQPIYQAGCLKSPTGSYCFADAITNISSPTDSYPYFLALGINLPGGSRPTCNKCLSEVMNVYRNAAGNSTQPVSGTYVSAAQQIQLNCGPTFVESTVIQRGTASSFTSPSATSSAAAALIFLLLHILF